MSEREGRVMRLCCAAVVVLGSVLGCSATDGPAGDAQDAGTDAGECVPTALRIEPRQGMVEPGGSLAFTAQPWCAREDKPAPAGSGPVHPRWTSSDVGTASIDADGVAHGLHSGSTYIVAADGSLADSVTLTVAEGKLIAVQVMPEHTALIVGQELQYKAVGELDTGNEIDVTQSAAWSSLQPSIVTLSGSGLAKAEAAGNADVRAEYGGLAGGATATVLDCEPEGFAIEPHSSTVAAGNSVALHAVGKFCGGESVDLSALAAWSSTAPSTATVNASGMVQGVVPGLARIRATYDVFEDLAEVVVSQAVVETVEVFPPAVTLMTPSSTVAFQATAVYSDEKRYDVTTEASWSSSHVEVASTDDAGKATAQGCGGTTEIAAVYGGISGEAVLENTAAPQITSLSAAPGTVHMPAGASVALTATAGLAQGGDLDVSTTVAWEVSDGAVVQIIPGLPGYLQALAEGSTEVTARLCGLVSPPIAVTVGPAELAGLQILPAHDFLRPQCTQQLTAMGFYTDLTEKDVSLAATWTTENHDIALIATSPTIGGLVLGRQFGQTTARASFGGLVSDPVPVCVGMTYCARHGTASAADGGLASLAPDRPSTASSTGGPERTPFPGHSEDAAHQAAHGKPHGTALRTTIVSMQVWPSVSRVPVGGRVQLMASVLFSDTTYQSFTSSASWQAVEPSVIETDSEGVVKGLAPGESAVKANVSGQSASGLVVVYDASLASLDVFCTPGRSHVGIDSECRATLALSDGTAQDVSKWADWAVADPAVATLSGFDESPKTVSAVAIGTTTVSASYEGLSAGTPFAVAAGQPTALEIAVDRAPMPILARRDARATARFDDGLSADVTKLSTWVSSDADVVEVDGGALLSYLPGQAIVSASFGALGASTAVTVSDATLSAVEIRPAYLTVHPYAIAELDLVGAYSDGTRAEPSAITRWSSLDSTILDVEWVPGRRGRALASSPGATSVAAGVCAAESSVPAVVLSGAGTALESRPPEVIALTNTQIRLRAIGAFDDGTTGADLTHDVSWLSGNTVAAHAAGGGWFEVRAPASDVPLLATYTPTGAQASSRLTVVAGPPQDIFVWLEGPGYTGASFSPVPAEATLAPASILHAVAYALFDDGAGASMLQNVTTSVRWSSSDPTLVAVSNATGSQGWVQAAPQPGAPGGATVTALFGTGGSQKVSNPVLVHVTPCQALTSLEVCALDARDTCVPVPDGAPAIVLSKGTSTRLGVVGTFDTSAAGCGAIAPGTNTFATYAARWWSEDPTIAEAGWLAGAGEVRPVGAGGAVTRAHAALGGGTPWWEDAVDVRVGP